MEIYEPSDDSYLLLNCLKEFLVKKNKDIKILDIGTGSGIQAKECKIFGFKDITVSDINPNSIKNLKKLGFKSIKSDLFSNINQKFDLIIFNPPYLPEDKNEPLSSRIITTGGKNGNEIILRFLEDSIKHIKKNGTILLLISSLSKPKIILKKIKSLNYNYKLLSRKKLFFEELYVYQLSL